MSNLQTVYIDCNKSASMDKDNLDNSQFTMDLKESITLPKGSQISIQSSFINQQGITGNSIEIEQDILETFNVHFYKTDTADFIPNRTTSQGESVYFNCTFSDPPIPAADTRINLIDQSAGNDPGIVAITNFIDVSAIGATEQPLILLSTTTNTSGSPHVTLADVHVKTITIDIKKGTYGITELANIITDHINGRLDSEENQVNPVQERIVDGIFTTQNLAVNTLTTINVPITTTASNKTNPAIPTHGETYIFTDVHTAETIRKARITLNDGTGILYDNGTNGAGRTGMSQLYMHSANDSADYDYDPLRKQVYCGTADMSIDYNTDTSSFEINGLHTPYIIPSHDANFNAQELAGKQGVFFRRPTDTIAADIQGSITNQTAKDLLLSSVSNPISRFGGIIVHNWAYTTAKKYGTKKGIADIENVKNKYRFKDFFNEEREAKEVWKKTLWSRLGFDYDQLNGDKNMENIRYYNNPTTTRLAGTTTNTYIDDSVIQSLSTDVCDTHFDIDPTTKGANPVIGRPLKVQSGSVKTYGLIDANTIKRAQTTDNVGLFANSIYPEASMIPVEAAPRAITARNLPVLSKSGYYLITSDILDGYNDIVKNGDPLALLGVVAKSSLSNQDFIYSSQDIVNTITNDKIINKIKIRFLNPDLTSPDLESNSSVILRIDKPIVETQGQLIAEMEEQKEQKK